MERSNRWRAAVAGAAGGAILAAADYLPSAGWLPEVADRARLAFAVGKARAEACDLRL